MGIYLNPGNQNFYEAVNKEIYVDKSLLIQQIEYLRTKMNNLTVYNSVDRKVD